MPLKISQIVKLAVAKRLFGYGPVDDYSAVSQFTGPAKDITLLGMYSGVAYRCINTLAEAIAGQYVPYFYSLNAKGKQVTQPDHPFLTLLTDPNPDLTYYQLIEGSASFVEQFGEFFWYLVPGQLSGSVADPNTPSSGIKQIYLLRPDKMGIVLDKKTGEVIGYKYQVGTAGSTIPFSVDEIRHFMTFNPKNPYRGYSTVEAAFDYIQTEEEVSRFTRNYFRNNAAMSGILSVEGKLTRENWNKFVRQWRERYQGVENAGKVALVRDSQVSFTPVTSSIQDMQLNDLKETTVDQILMMFRIPKGLFGMESDQGLGRASVETLEYIFAKWTIDNKLDRMDDFIEGILKDFYPKQTYLVSHNNIIPDDKEFELNRVNLLVDRVITRQEVREKDPDLANTIIPGAQQLFTTIQQMPLIDPVEQEAKDQAAAEAAQTLAETQAKKPASDDSDEEDDKTDTDDKDLDEDEDTGTKGGKITLVKAKKKDLRYNTNQKEAYRLSVERNSIAYSRSYRKAFNTVLTKQEQTVLGNIQHLAAGLKKGIADTLLNMSDEDSNFNKALTPVLTELTLEQGKLAMEFSGGDAKNYTPSQSLAAAVAASTKKMSQNFDATTVDQLNDTLNEGLQNGESISELSDRVSDVYDQASDYRSDRVARTEASSASNGATLDAYQQNPVVTEMTWYANPDACEYCEELDGTTVGLETSFVSQGDSVDVDQDDGSTDSYQADYGDVDTPPLHPNCSCTIIPVTN